MKTLVKELVIAAQKGDEQSLRELIGQFVSKGINIDSLGEDGYPALLHAVAEGQITSVRLLLDAGANPRISYESKQASAFHLAAELENSDLIDLMFQHQNSLNSLNSLSSFNSSNSIHSLDSIHSFLNMKNQIGFTPLHFAAGKDQFEMVEKLIALGADIEAQDNRGRTPLHIAAEKNAAETIGVLLSQHDETERVDDDDNAVKKRRTQKTANIEARDYKNRTPLHWAAVTGSKEALETLLVFNADREAMDDKGRNPIFYALGNGFINLLIYFSEQEIKNTYEFFAKRVIGLHSGNWEIAEILRVGIDMGKFDAINMILCRALNFVFGNRELKELLKSLTLFKYDDETRDEISDYEGGYFEYDTLPFVAAGFYAFISEKIKADKNNENVYRNLYRNILPLLDNEKIFSEANELTHKIKQGEPVLIFTGHTEHGLFICLELIDGKIVLSRYERGEYSDVAIPNPYRSDQASSVARITIPEDKIEEVINKLIKLRKEEDSEVSRNFILNEITEVVQSDYVYQQIYQKRFKEPNCFYENIKPVFLDHFRKELGEEHGTVLYKELVIFWHELAFKNFLAFYRFSDENTYQKNKISNLCKEITQKLKDKLWAISVMTDMSFFASKQPVEIQGIGSVGKPNDVPGSMEYIRPGKQEVEEKSGTSQTSQYRFMAFKKNVQKVFSGQRVQVCNVANSDFKFTRHEVDSDGDCGYTAFGVTRKQAYRLITENLNQVRDLFKPLIEEQLLNTKFIQYLCDNKFASPGLLRAFDDYQRAAERGGEMDQSIIDGLKRHANDLSFAQVYINYDIRDKQIDAGWVHLRVLQALAYVLGIRLKTWQLNSQGELVPHNHYPCYGSEEVSLINILFINNSHFERLEVFGSEKYETQFNDEFQFK